MPRIATTLVSTLTGVAAIALTSAPAGAATPLGDARWRVNDELLSTIKTTWLWGALILVSISVVNRVVRSHRRKIYMAAQTARARHNPLARRFG